MLLFIRSLRFGFIFQNHAKTDNNDYNVDVVAADVDGVDDFSV